MVTSNIISIIAHTGIMGTHNRDMGFSFTTALAMVPVGIIMATILDILAGITTGDNNGRVQFGRIRFRNVFD